MLSHSSVGSGCQDEYGDDFGMNPPLGGPGGAGSSGPHSRPTKAPFGSAVKENALHVPEHEDEAHDSGLPSPETPSKASHLRRLSFSGVSEQGSIQSLGSARSSLGNTSIASRQSRFDFGEDEGETDGDSSDGQQALSQEVRALADATTTEEIVTAAVHLSSSLVGTKVENRVRRFKKDLEKSLKYKGASVIDDIGKEDLNRKFVCVLKLGKSLDHLRENIAHSFLAVADDMAKDNVEHELLERLPWNSSPWFICASALCRKAGVNDILLEKISRTAAYCQEKLKNSIPSESGKAFSHLKNHDYLIDAYVPTALTPLLKLMQSVRTTWKSISGIDIGMRDKEAEHPSEELTFEFSSLPLRTRRDICSSLILCVKLIEKWNQVLCQCVYSFGALSEKKSSDRAEPTKVGSAMSWTQQRISIINMISLLYSNLYRCIDDSQLLLEICKQLMDETAVESMLHEGGNLVSKTDVTLLERGLTKATKVSGDVMHGLTFHFSRCFIEIMLTQVFTDLGYYDWMAFLPLQSVPGPSPAIRLLNTRLASLLFEFDTLGALPVNEEEDITSVLQDFSSSLSECSEMDLGRNATPTPKECDMCRPNSWAQFALTHVLRESMRYLQGFYSTISFQFSQQPQVRSDLAHALVSSLAIFCKIVHVAEYEQNKALLLLYSQCVHQINCLLWELLISCSPMRLLREFVEETVLPGTLFASSMFNPAAFVAPLQTFASHVPISTDCATYAKQVHGGRVVFDAISSFSFAGLVRSPVSNPSKCLTECQTFLGGCWTGRREDIESRKEDLFPWKALFDSISAPEEKYCPYTKPEFVQRVKKRSELGEEPFPPLPEEDSREALALKSLLDKLDSGEGSQLG
eukprot:gb/GECG01002017.1/.p1 GENE.gb/GECG01002017.1/~~gb/GECG01002017.1/.p1  ORF type:complete len:862 (+),score=101.30 gb/GECG01002017.1/:1-2586(+)